MRILFIGHNGYGYPHTRVRCYHFAKALMAFPDMQTGVLSFRDDLAPDKTEAEMYRLRDREKLCLTGRALLRLLAERDTLLYIQKAHFHAAAPYWLNRLGFCPHYVLDYDDFDIPLSNFFGRGVWNRLFFGSNEWDIITYSLIQRALGCVAASHSLSDFLSQRNPRVAYVPTGVDTDVFTPAPSSPNREVVYVWNGLVWGRPILNNILLMFRAFQAVHLKLPAYCLRMVGGGELWNEAKETAQKEFPQIPIDWIGWTQPEAMPEILRQADVGLLPTDGRDEWLCGKSPTKLFEYMAAGLPVAASDVGEAAWVQESGETGFLARNERDYAEAILELGRHPELRERMGKRAREVAVANFSLPVIGENLYHFLKGIRE